MDAAVGMCMTTNIAEKIARAYELKSVVNFLKEK